MKSNKTLQHVVVPNNNNNILLNHPTSATTTTFGQIRSQPITLNLMDYESWNAQQVASVLTSPKSLGAGLSVDDVKPLYESCFDGEALHNIVEDIQKKDVYFALDQLENYLKERVFQMTFQLSDTCQTVVFWVLNQLMTRQYSLWRLEPVSKQIIQKLSEPITKGGADLSLDQVSSLDGKTLIKIGTAIEKERVKGITEEKCIKNAIKMIKSDKDFASVPKSTCKAVAEWIATKLTKASEGGSLINIPSELFDLWKFKGEISEDLRKERENPRYDYLRNLHDPTNMKKLEKLIGTFIDLPVLGTKDRELSPTAFNPNAKYLLTQQRFDVLKTLVNGSTGMVLSGPYGSSKSYTLYLIAAYAFVNSFPVLFVPRCHIWIRDYDYKKNIGANNYLRRLFFSLNSDILSQTQIIELQKSIDILRHLSKEFGSKRSVFYLFDEHNELFIPDTDNNIHASEEYFQDFTRWTGVTSGENTVTIYCGCAHSSFENNLPRGEEKRLVRMIPPTPTEFETLITDFGLDPKDKRIAHVTGRNPRELNYLAHFLKDKKGSDKDFNLFFNERVNIYDRRLDSLVRKLDKSKNEQFEKTLEDLFTLGLFNGRPDNVSGIVYDIGLLYKDSNGKLFIINDPAKRCLFNHYCRLDMPKIPKNISDSEKGAMFKKYLLRQEYGLRRQLDSEFYVTNNLSTTTTSTLSLSYYVHKHASLDLKDLSSLDRNNYLKGIGVLFIPESETFPSFDYAIVMYKGRTAKIFLKKTTISTIDSHYCHSNGNTDVENLLERCYVLDREGKAMKRTQNVPEQYHFSLLELILHGIVGTEEAKAEELLQARKDDLTFIKDGNLESSVTYGGVQFTWYFIYESGEEEQSVKKVKENGILFRNRQEIETHMKIYFEK
ncbi:hypothetical protein C9374_013122 [Naegleria lovaniensis]|uniref:Uncharacterized protein n=1 Tax=Naegleria lovaniensis TaxID=51637 RepID=A0AA88G6M2_NAELO|nr:uncharacterized protein C9374_013122 [Naegleria lovaniensis]KAG2372842.1 hypothetical protein C9374_013122 [Naegleria lovaniensis]